MFDLALREWRTKRGLSQMGLALAADVSPRHVSFLETARARPSAEMVLRLAETLDLPLRDRNALLVAAGFAPRYGESDATSEVLQAAKILLDAHEAYPALVLDAAFNVLDANRAALDLIVGEREMPGHINLVDLVFIPGPIRDSIVNWVDVAEYLLHRMHDGVRRHGPQSAMSNVLLRAMQQPGTTQLSTSNGHRHSAILPLEFRRDDQVTRWFTTVTSFDAPTEAVAKEITIELFYPSPN